MEVRTIIKLCSYLGKTPTEMMLMINTTAQHKDAKHAFEF